MKEIDARNKPCPQPVIETKRVVENGFTSLKIRLNSEISMNNVKRFLEKSAFSVEIIGEKQDIVVIAEKSEGPEDSRHLSASESLPHSKGIDTILISSNRFGRGSENLGTMLMIVFLDTLREVEPKPSMIAFMNSGVRLVLKDSDSLDAVRSLEASGVEIISCGTCLNEIGKTDDLAVGKIGNMYGIASALMVSKNVLTIA